MIREDYVRAVCSLAPGEPQIWSPRVHKTYVQGKSTWNQKKKVISCEIKDFLETHIYLQAAWNTAKLESKRVTRGVYYVWPRLLIVKIVVCNGRSTTLRRCPRSSRFCISYHSGKSNARKQATHSQPKILAQQSWSKLTEIVKSVRSKEETRGPFAPGTWQWEQTSETASCRDEMRFKCRTRYGFKLSAFVSRQDT